MTLQSCLHENNREIEVHIISLLTENKKRSVPQNQTLIKSHISNYLLCLKIISKLPSVICGKTKFFHSLTLWV